VDVEDAVIRDCVAPQGAARFLETRGACRRVVEMGNDVSRVG
jgi:hypothetical protein